MRSIIKLALISSPAVATLVAAESPQNLRGTTPSNENTPSSYGRKLFNTLMTKQESTRAAINKALEKIHGHEKFAKEAAQKASEKRKLQDEISSSETGMIIFLLALVCTIQWIPILVSMWFTGQRINRELNPEPLKKLPQAGVSSIKQMRLYHRGDENCPEWTDGIMKSMWGSRILLEDMQCLRKVGFCLLFVGLYNMLILIPGEAKDYTLTGWLFLVSATDPKDMATHPGIVIGVCLIPLLMCVIPAAVMLKFFFTNRDKVNDKDPKDDPPEMSEDAAARVMQNAAKVRADKNKKKAEKAKEKEALKQAKRDAGLPSDDEDEIKKLKKKQKAGKELTEDEAARLIQAKIKKKNQKKEQAKAAGGSVRTKDVQLDL